MPEPGAPDSAATDVPRPIDPGVDIGHVHLKVADIERALDFYCGVLGFELMQRYGTEAAFISAGGYHHHIGLNTWQSRGGSPPAPGTTGLFHLAIRYPTRASLADALRRLVEARVPLEGASDHGVSEALYLTDPDGNGVELYWDRPREDWPAPASPGEKVGMYTRPLDLDGLLAEVAAADPARRRRDTPIAAALRVDGPKTPGGLEFSARQPRPDVEIGQGSVARPRSCRARRRS